MSISFTPTVFGSVTWRQIMEIEDKYTVDKIDEQVKILRESGEYEDTILSNEEISEMIIKYFVQNDLTYCNLWLSENHCADSNEVIQLTNGLLEREYKIIINEYPIGSALSRLFG